MNDRTFINLWLRLALLVLLAFGVLLATAQGVEVLEGTAEYRAVKHAFSETRIPAQAERVVSPTVSLTDALLEFFFGQPVGVPFYWAGKHASYLGDDLAGVSTPGNDEYTLTREAIVAQQPDPILTYAFDGLMNSNLTFEQGNRLATSLLADEQKLRDVRAALVGGQP